MIIKNELIMDIIDREWKMFRNVKNIGGRAACQENFATFFINRMSQAESWSVPALMSYLRDLETAELNGRNLLAEKYARMMASTSPDDYKRIVHLLPALDDDVMNLVEQIVRVVLEWEKQLADQYPHIIQQGRPISSSRDTPITTSVETYLRGELLTFSLKTLKLYYENVMEQKAENINGSEVILEAMIKQYGHASLEQANEEMRKTHVFNP
jgi:hypothetical protein